MNRRTTRDPVIFRFTSRAITALAALVLLICAASPAPAWEIDTTHKWAWSATAGWVNHRATPAQAAVYADHLEGYAWAENIGWVRLGTHTGGGAHTYLNTAADNYGVNSDSSGNLSGFGWSANAGWIRFDPTHGGVSVDPATGDFSGYAWSENTGWIRFAGTAQDSTAYKVQYTTTPSPTTYTVTYDGNGAESGSVPADPNSPYAGGDEVTVLGNTGSLARSGFVFGGWNTQARGDGVQYASGATFDMPSYAVTLYAQWSSSEVTISPTRRTHAPDAVSRQDITVTTGMATTWTASPGAVWITIIGGASGTGSGTVTYEIDANTAPNLPRTETISIADKVCTITQGTSHWQISNGTGTGCQGQVTGEPYFVEVACQAAPQPRPPGMVFPWGLFGFRIVNVPSGGQVTVTFTMTYDIPAGSVFYRYDPGTETYTPYANTGGLDDGDDIFTVTLTDGGAGDRDGVVNGEILDPGGVGILATAIPTLTEWGMIVFALLIAGAAIVSVKRRRGMTG